MGKSASDEVDRIRQIKLTETIVAFLLLSCPDNSRKVFIFFAETDIQIFPFSSSYQIVSYFRPSHFAWKWNFYENKLLKSLKILCTTKVEFSWNIQTLIISSLKTYSLCLKIYAFKLDPQKLVLCGKDFIHSFIHSLQSDS